MTSSNEMKIARPEMKSWLRPCNSLKMLYKPAHRIEGFGQVYEHHTQPAWLLNAFLLELS